MDSKMINSKIYELAKQADLIEFDTIPGSNAVTPSYESIVKARKFAELIIRECLEIVNEEVTYIADEYAADNVTGPIKAHFGVNE
jgi:hypothetical protein